MLFSSITFLYYFLPLVIALYFIVPKRFKNFILLLASLFFYYWGEKVYVIAMIILSITGYIFGLLIDKFRDSKLVKVFLTLSVIFPLATLGIFKYTDFFIENINNIFNSNIELLKIALPIGISFYTFQILSYNIDLYRRNTVVQKNLINFMTYVSMFPQLIAGPIVRYSDVADQLNVREHTLSNAAYGINRFIVGLSKKVLIANLLGEFCNIFKSAEEQTLIFTWAYAIAFALHIYFDFSGYSDMAIGLGKIFGFNFPENFNYPYISKSITEFWRRWHMTLSSWFRDYVYIPLGGNRVSKLKWLRNIFVVWALTGFWHGAAWNFILWGLFFAVLLVIEKFLLKKYLDKIPSIFSRIYALFFVLISWVIFDAATFSDISLRLSMMFGLTDKPLINVETIYYIKSYAVIFIIAIIGATPIVKNLISGEKIIKIRNVLEPIVHLTLMLIVTAYLVDGSFNPFIYFRF